MKVSHRYLNLTTWREVLQWRGWITAAMSPSVELGLADVGTHTLRTCIQ